MTTTISGSTGVNQITDDAITDAKLPAGSVLQVVNFRSTVFNTTTTSQSYVDTGIEASITPSSTNSKILVVANLNGVYKSTGQNAVSTRLLRGSTALGDIDSMNTYTDSTAPSASGASISYLDSPSTSSAVTYKVQFASISGALVYINIRWNGSYTTHSTLTLMEIAG
tara:strand:+ start:67 stop:570 length:504 start_codon:yes stop_codon:yes gene_type:complete